MKILYYDCFAGISGDMHLGAMIDAGVDPDHLTNELKKLPLTGFKLNIQRDQRMGIEGTRVDVIVDNADDLENPVDVEGNKPLRQEHSHHHNHSHRNLHDIETIITKSKLPEPTKSRAMKMFRLIAEAEAKIHGMPIDKIHFHEVGAVDSIVDITGAAICLEYLKPDRILSSTIELGGGTVKCAHGQMPVPAPATSEILKNNPVRLGSTRHEATTPTGAAILAANVDQFTDHLQFQASHSAYGIGQRDAVDLPNVLRVFVGEMDDGQADIGECMMIECNIDDMNPEFHEHVMETLFSQGAYDVFLTPVIMKKSRPAVILSVLCDKPDQHKLSEILLQHTTTLGVRSHTVSRMMLDRGIEKVTTSLGPITIKKAWYKGKLMKWKPEYDECKALADKHGLSIQEVHRIIESETNSTQKIIK